MCVKYMGVKPASESTAQERFMARWYETFLDSCTAAKRRSLGIVTHPSNKAAIMDMMERVYEDPLWQLGDLPPLLVHHGCPPGEYRFVEPETLDILTAQAAMQTNKGIGRYSKLLTPDQSLKES
jgi:predicted protein tyrosine phosphatase